MGAHDFNSVGPPVHACSTFGWKGMARDVLRTGRVRPIDGTPAATRVRYLRQTLRRRVWGPRLLLPRSIPLHGLRPTDVPREPARYRDVPPLAPARALPCRLPWSDRAEHA